MVNDEDLPESKGETDTTASRVLRKSSEEEFETIKGEFKSWSEYSKDFETRNKELWTQFSKHNPMYLPVLNGHLMIEELLNQLLSESVKHPKCLRDDYTFAERLNILQSVSPLASTALIWKLLAKLNGLRNAVAHGSDHKKKLKILRDIQRLIRESRLRSENELNNPDWIITYAFAMASFDLDLLISATRLRNLVHRFLEKLGPEHPLALETFGMLQVLELAVIRDIV
jgi:hypothetical protein